MYDRQRMREEVVKAAFECSQGTPAQELLVGLSEDLDLIAREDRGMAREIIHTALLEAKGWKTGFYMKTFCERRILDAWALGNGELPSLKTSVEMARDKLATVVTDRDTPTYITEAIREARALLEDALEPDRIMDRSAFLASDKGVGE